MLSINNVKIYGINESLVASGYPMIAEDIGEWDSSRFNNLEADIKRMSKLGNVPTGTGHDNALKGITVQFDVKYPNYWTPQFQRYSFLNIVSSTSKMHRLVKMDLKKACNEYVDMEVLDRVNYWIGIYNLLTSRKSKEAIKIQDSWYANKEDALRIHNKRKPEELHISLEDIESAIETRISIEDVYMRIISNCPMGLEQTMRVSTNYLQLKTIYLQRKNHKLKDWKVFCDWVESLPHFKDFCLASKENKDITIGHDGVYFIQDTNTKEAGKKYIDRITGKIYLCLVSTDSTFLEKDMYKLV